MITPYDETNQLHEFNLKKLFSLAFNQEPANDENERNLPLVNDTWKDIGFQGKNPRTDFRGGGHLSLLCLIYFVQNYKREFTEMARVTKDEEEKMWLTAISSINVTHHLIIYLYMNDGDVPQSHLKIRAGRN